MGQYYNYIGSLNMIKPSARETRLVSFCLFLLICAGSTSLNAAEKTLSDELRTLGAMRKGFDTPADQVEARGKALLEKYADPGQRALIHHQLAFIHGQSGLMRPDLVAEHCEAALRLPSLDEAKRLQLYSYHGDAKQMMNRVRSEKDKLSFPEIRRDATNVYLQGLKESTEYNIPEIKPELPSMERIEHILGDPNDPEFKRRVAESRKRNEEYVRKKEQARRDQEAWEFREILYYQIVYLYLRQPAADEQMQELAAGALPDAMVKVLLDRFEEMREAEASGQPDAMIKVLLDRYRGKAGMREPKIDTPPLGQGDVRRTH